MEETMDTLAAACWCWSLACLTLLLADLFSGE